MIKAIDIQNVQSLRYVELPLGKLTVVLGETGSGKTAFVRAIQAAVDNRRGDEFISWGSRQAIVEIITDDAVVQWRKGTSSGYTITLADGTSKDFERVGAGCPVEVSKILQMGVISLTDIMDVSINFHEQFDTPFLMMSSSSLRAKLLGELTNINLLYLASREAKRITDATATEARMKESLYDELCKKAQKYSTLPEIKSKLDSLSLQLVAVEASAAVLREMRGTVVDLELVTKNRGEAYDAVVKAKQIVTVIKPGLSVLALKIRRVEEQGSVFRELFACQVESANVSRGLPILRELVGKRNSIGLAGASLLLLKEEIKLAAELACQVHAEQLAVEEWNNANEGVITATSAFVAYKADNPLCPLCGKTL